MSPFSRLVRWPKEIHHKGWSLTVFFNEKDIGSLFSFPSDGEAKTRSGFSEFDLSFEAVFLLRFFILFWIIKCLHVMLKKVRVFSV